MIRDAGRRANGDWLAGLTVWVQAILSYQEAVLDQQTHPEVQAAHAAYQSALAREQEAFAAYQAALAHKEQAYAAYQRALAEASRPDRSDHPPVVTHPSAEATVTPGLPDSRAALQESVRVRRKRRHHRSLRKRVLRALFPGQRNLRQIIALIALVLILSVVLGAAIVVFQSQRSGAPPEASWHGRPDRVWAGWDRDSWL